MTVSPERPGLLDLTRLRRDFPILEQEIHGRPLAYLDNAATAQKPRCVIEAISTHYAESNANVHRGVHALSDRATALFEAARETVRRFLGAGSAREIVFVRGATEAINLVAQSWGRVHLAAGDEIVLTRMEHHSNIVPWQLLRDQSGVVLKVAQVDDRGDLVVDDLLHCLGPRVRLLAVCHVSNAIGTINPVERLVAEARARGIPTLIDGAQAVVHGPVDVRALDCDFYVFSGHKVYGPTGIGALYAKQSQLEKMAPYQGGGEMIRTVTFEKTDFADVPHKFEAGTPSIAGAIGLAAALDYLGGLDWKAVIAHEDALLAHATASLTAIPGVRLIGTPRRRTAALSFTVDGIDAHTLGALLDEEGIAIRAGHHCAMPLLDHFGVAATARVSFAIYNTTAEVDRFVDAVARCCRGLPRGDRTS